MNKWKLVPIEPTPEMMKAGASVPLNKAARHNAVYRMMIEAAPQSPTISNERLFELLKMVDPSAQRLPPGFAQFASVVIDELLNHNQRSNGLDEQRSN